MLKNKDVSRIFPKGAIDDITEVARGYHAILENMGKEPSGSSKGVKARFIQLMKERGGAVTYRGDFVGIDIALGRNITDRVNFLLVYNPFLRKFFVRSTRRGTGYVIEDADAERNAGKG